MPFSHRAHEPCGRLHNKVLTMNSAVEELESSRKILLIRFADKKDSTEFLNLHTSIMDRYFENVLQESQTGTRLFLEKEPFALVALGGYGREELCVHSDIDVMILFGGSIPQLARPLAQEILFPLWNLGLDMGYSVRSLKDCLKLAGRDFKVLTSIMDARFLCGDSSLFQDFIKMLKNKVDLKKAQALAEWLKKQHDARMKEFGDSSHLLEPDLKEGIGGLRDYHSVLWLSAAFFQTAAPRDLEYNGILSHKEYNELRKNLEFIWLVRNHLHSLSKRKKDRLQFEYQELIAQRLGFNSGDGQLAVERFMGGLHAAMSSIKATHRAFIVHHMGGAGSKPKASITAPLPQGLHLYSDEIYFDSAEKILSSPSLLIEIFEQSSVTGYPLSLNSERLVREFLFLVDNDFRKSEPAIKSFLVIVNSVHTPEILDRMFETGFLEAFIPEFAHVKDRVQFDSYHIFPVGRHSLETVRHLKQISTQNDILLLDIFSEISSSEPLFLAALFHDFGKVGENHPVRGADLTKGILSRFGYKEKKSADILFLIRYHLLLVETATARDLNDEKAIVQCARMIQTIHRLKMLYLLTWADSMATGPKAWTDWIASLVRELFFKVLHILEQGELATLDASRKAENSKAEVLRLWSKKTGSEQVEVLFDTVSPRYILNVAPKDIVQHKLLAKRLEHQIKTEGHSAFVFEIFEDQAEGCWKANFLSQDRPGLFSDIAGVLALNNINVLSAQIFTWRDNTAVDIFSLSAPPDPLHPEETWSTVKNDLKDVLMGKLSLPYRLGQKAKPTIISGRLTLSRPPAVKVDNRSSDFFTLIEVVADDRVGRLYFITRALFDLRLDIRTAKIATKGDQIIDIFYVRDLEGQKVEDERKIREIRESILFQLEID